MSVGITNVADPVRGTDAANKQYVDHSVGAVRSEMKKTDKKLRGGIAGATAAANIPQVTKPGGSMVGLGVGNYKGEKCRCSRLLSCERSTIKLSLK